MSDAASIELPSWAQVSERRRAHIARVTGLLMLWAEQMRLTADEAATWRDAGVFHDALRDATEPELREWSRDALAPVGLLHGPAAARRLEDEGETRGPLLLAVRWHTVGNAGWDRTGRALFMADYLEPGRPFAQADRSFLIAHVPKDFDGVFRQVVRQRLEWSLREGKGLYPETVALWNQIR